MKDEYTESSGNVFEDLGLERPEERQTKADVALLINSIISDKTQEQAANILGISQPQVSDLSRGKLKHFSVERLFELLIKLGCNIQIVVSEADEKDKLAQIEVIAA